MREYVPAFECTWYCAKTWLERYGTEVLYFPAPGIERHAKIWATLAREVGLTISERPVKGAVAIFHEGPYGHVAIVEGVNTDLTINVSEYNYAGPHIFGERKRVKPAAAYILPPNPNTEDRDAWETMNMLGVYTKDTHHGSELTIERLAVFMYRLYGKLHK